jgi:hypothetical protein
MNARYVCVRECKKRAIKDRGGVGAPPPVHAYMLYVLPPIFRAGFWNMQVSVSGRLTLEEDRGTRLIWKNSPSFPTIPTARR